MPLQNATEARTALDERQKPFDYDTLTMSLIDDGVTASNNGFVALNLEVDIKGDNIIQSDKTELPLLHFVKSLEAKNYKVGYDIIYSKLVLHLRF